MNRNSTFLIFLFLALIFGCNKDNCSTCGNSSFPTDCSKLKDCAWDNSTNKCVCDIQNVPSAPTPDCSDGIKNQDETSIDCGGTKCIPCHCRDGSKNYDETGIDCGGRDCTVCPSCTDGIKNQNEAFIDCGGPCAEKCFDSFIFYVNGVYEEVVESWAENKTTDGSIYVSGKVIAGSVVNSIDLNFIAKDTGLVNLTSYTKLSRSTDFNGGTVKITFLDPINKRISGTFQFSAKSIYGSYNVTNGIFINYKYL